MKLPDEVEIGLVVGAFIVGCAAFWIQLKDRRARRPAYRKSTIPIVSSPVVSFPEIKITYRGELVHDLSLSELFFWNDGRGAFHQHDLDVGEGHQLRVVAIPPGRIFKPIQLVADAKNGVSVLDKSEVDAESATEAIITFKYLSPGEGWVVRMKHTGDVELKGAFRDAEDLHHKVRPTGLWVFVSFLAAMASLLFDCFYLAAIASGFLLWSLVAQKQNPAPAKFRKFLKGKGIDLSP